VEQGGQVVTRRATYGTNGDPSEWLPLHSQRQFCEFVDVRSTGNGRPLRLSLDLATLWSTEPTLATLAYYEPSPPQPAEVDADPAAAYCTQLGGASSFGGQENPAGGSWVPDEPSGDENVQLFDHCLFPDESTIDKTALISNSLGITVGVDLRTVLRYRPAQLPQIYPGGEPRETTAPGVPALPVTPNEPPEPDPDAVAYCEEQGGQVILRTFAYNANADPDQWLLLGTPTHFCEFDAQPDTTADPGSHIAVDLDTFYSEEPTLAALAYLAQPSMGDIPPGVNPAPVYCSQLGGSSTPTGPDNITGGGWTNQEQPVFVVLAMCVFADGSMIDDWGVTYHTNGAIRGADLAPLLRYQPDTLPTIY
jgi:putative hemolysin